MHTRVSNPVGILISIFFACLFGMLVAAQALKSGLDSTRSSALMYPSSITQHRIKELQQNIEGYRKKKHTLPGSLDQVDEGQGRDDWGNPFVYTVQGDKYLLISYGHDGKPGGIGWDTDLTSENLRPPGAEMTFQQFLHYRACRGMIITACISGVVAALLCLLTIRPIKRVDRRLTEVAIRLLVTLIATSFVALLITALHIPTGH